MRKCEVPYNNASEVIDVADADFQTQKYGVWEGVIIVKFSSSCWTDMFGSSPSSQEWRPHIYDDYVDMPSKRLNTGWADHALVLWRSEQTSSCSRMVADKKRIFEFFSVRSNFYFTEWTLQTVFSRVAVATNENTDCGVHECNKIQSYTEKLKFSVSFMLLFAIIMFLPTCQR